MINTLRSISLCPSQTLKLGFVSLCNHHSNVHEIFSFKKLYLWMFCMFYLWIYLCCGCLRCLYLLVARTCGKCLNWKCRRISVCSHVKWFFFFFCFNGNSIFWVFLQWRRCILVFLSFHTSLCCWIGFVNTVYSYPYVLCLYNVYRVVTWNENRRQVWEFYFAESHLMSLLAGLLNIFLTNDGQ